MMINQVRDTERPSWTSTTVHGLFAIDPRTLALFRMAIAGMLLVTLVTRAFDLRSMYTDQGALPGATVRAYYSTFEQRGAWSLHWLDDRPAFEAALFGVAGVLGAALLVGFQTRCVTVGSWLLLASLHTRVAGLVVNGGDVLLLLMLFWGMFLPLGRCWSVDAWRGGQTPSLDPVLSVGTAAALIQLFLMYTVTGFSKCNAVWFTGRALERAFSIEQFANSVGRSLSDFPEFLRVATYGALALELVGPWLLFSPWLTRYSRPLAALGFATLHAGIALTMNVDLFSYNSLAALTLFVPAAVWRKRPMDRSPPLAAADPSATSRKLFRRLADGLCLLCLVFVVVYNVLMLASWPNRALPTGVRDLADVLAFGQRWDMFSHGGGADFRIVGVARLRDGSEVDILRDGAPVNGNLEQLEPALPRQRWTLLFTELKRKYNGWFRQSVARFLCRTWNDRQPPERQITAFELLLLEQDLSPGAAPGATNTQVLVQLDLLGSGTYAFDRASHLWLRHGEWTLRYPSGKLKAQGSFRFGKEEGHWTHWLEDGSQHGEGSYQHGLMTGEWLIWEQGVVQREYYQ